MVRLSILVLARMVVWLLWTSMTLLQPSFFDVRRAECLRTTPIHSVHLRVTDAGTVLRPQGQPDMELTGLSTRVVEWRARGVVYDAGTVVSVCATETGNPSAAHPPRLKLQSC